MHVLQQYDKRHSTGISLLRTERFNLRDTQIGASYARPLNEALVATFDANASSLHRVLAPRLSS